MNYIIFGLLFSLSAFSFSPPNFKGNILDEAGVLTESQKTQLHGAIQDARDRADIWSAVYILSSLNGEPIEDVANKTFEHWKVGKEGKDNGLLFVVAINDRKMRIEVGYGLEGSLTDFTTTAVINQNLKPRFKNGDFSGGIAEGLDRLVKVQLKEEVIAPNKEDDSDLNTGKILYCVLFNFLLVGIFWSAFLVRNLSGRKYKLHWFGISLLAGHAAALGFSLFFCLFWGGGAPLVVIVPFNGIFMLAFGGIAMFSPLRYLLSDVAYAEWVGPWLEYDKEYKNWKQGFKRAEKSEELQEYLQKSPPPEKPGVFGRLLRFPKRQSGTVTTTTWRSTGTSGSSGWGSSSSSRSSSSSSSSSSRGGGRSGGGGSSGSW